MIVSLWSRLQSTFIKPKRYQRKKTYNHKAGHDVLFRKLAAMEQRFSGPVKAGNEYLATELNVSARQIRRYLAVLAEAGRIEISGAGRGRKIRVIQPQKQATYSNIRKPGHFKRPGNVQGMSRERPENVRPFKEYIDLNIDLYNYIKPPNKPENDNLICICGAAKPFEEKYCDHCTEQDRIIADIFREEQQNNAVSAVG